LAIAGLAGCLGSPGGDTGTERTTGDGHDDEPAGHGEESHAHDTVSEPKPSREVAVNTARTEDSTEYHFDPHVTWVEEGGTVTWRLESGVHTATAYHPGNDYTRLVPEGTEAWDSGTMSTEGETFEHTFGTEGVYHYLCKPHEQFGMIATVIVGKPDPDESHALSVMPEDKPEEVHGKLEQLNMMVREILGSGDHEDDGHHDGTATDDGHHDETETDGHHDGTATDGGHHNETETDSHHDGNATDDGHHDE
jgi:plastocyanin